MKSKKPSRAPGQRQPAAGDSGAKAARPSAFEPHIHPRSDDGNAFMPDPEGGPARIKDDLAESLAEEFISSATEGNETADEVLDGIVPEEIGGPFVETSAAEEFADDTDETNPPDADREPLPRPVAGLVQLPSDELEDSEVSEDAGEHADHQR
jgi:hypothetical protein